MNRCKCQQLKFLHGFDEVYLMNIQRSEIRRIISGFMSSDQWNHSRSEREQDINAFGYWSDACVSASQYEIVDIFGTEWSIVQYHLNKA